MNILATGNGNFFFECFIYYEFIASYDGDIVLWTIETGIPFMKLNSSEDIKPKLISLSWVYKQTVNFEREEFCSIN